MKIDKKKIVNKLLTFLNQATVEQIDEFADGNGKGIGITIAKRIVETRKKLPSGKFTSLEELKAIKGLGEDKLKDMLSAIAESEMPDNLVKSRTRFTFESEAPVFPDLEDKVKFVEIERESPGSESNPEQGKEYHLYYDRSMNKEELFSMIQSVSGFKDSNLDLYFAIQAYDDTFVSADPNTGVVSFSNQITDTETFHLQHFGNPHKDFDPNKHTGNVDRQKYPFLCVKIWGKLTDYNKWLYLDYNDRVVKFGDHGNAPHIPDYWDIYGIYSPPVWGIDLHKAFTLKNYYHNDVLNPDLRYFMSKEGNQLKVEVGSDIGYTRTVWFRYVDIVHDVTIRAKYDTPQHNNRHLVLDPGDKVAFESMNSYPSIPDKAKWDLMVFYGFWHDRENIACKVCLRSKANGNMLSVDQWDVLRCNSVGFDNEHAFLVEDGWWGGTHNDISLKTHKGKYLLGYQNQAKADSVVPIHLEQFKIEYP